MLFRLDLPVVVEVDSAGSAEHAAVRTDDFNEPVVEQLIDRLAVAVSSRS